MDRLVSASRGGVFGGYGELLRLSLFPSAIGDAAVGVLLGAGLWPLDPRVTLVLGASLLTYHGGMALNDWADRGEDGRVRPARPIPSGRVSPGGALGLSAVMLLLGPALLATLDPIAGACGLMVAALAAIYDVAGRGPWRGPLLLGACRAGNVLSAAVAGAALTPLVGPQESLWRAAPFALAYAAYVFFIGRLGRFEDDESTHPGSAPVPLLRACGVLLLLGPGLAAFSRSSISYEESLLVTGGVLLAALASLKLFRMAADEEDWDRHQVLVAMGQVLRRLIVFTAAGCLATGVPAGFFVALGVLAGLPLSKRLRLVFPPS